MDEMIRSLPLLLIALLAVTLVATVGAIASRRLQFNYGYLTVVSLAVYALLGYHAAAIAGIKMVLLAGFIVGTYDATGGFKLSKVCKAHLRIYGEEGKKITYEQALITMAVIAPLFSFVGYILRTN
jgi:hypothetical protein